MHVRPTARIGSRVPSILGAALLSVILAFCPLARAEPRSGFTAVDGGVYASVWWNGSWIVGGQFSSIDGVEARGVARWDGSAWHPMDEGLAPAATGTIIVQSLLNWNGVLYAAGNFWFPNLPAWNLARWNGNAWVPVVYYWGVGDSDDMVYALAVHDGQLYAGGMFSHPGNIVRVGDAALGGGTDDIVFSLASWNGKLIAGGYFHNAGGVPVAHIAQWDGSSWAPLGAGVEGTHAAVFALAGPSADALYVGGRFSTAGGEPASNIARWDGSAWSALGAGVDGVVRALTAGADGLWVGGDFTSADGIPANHVARCGGEGWTPAGEGLPFSVRGLGVREGEAIAGGMQAVSRWGGFAWEPLGVTMSVDGGPEPFSSVKVVPNPSRSGVGVEFVADATGPTRLDVFDAAGRAVFTDRARASADRPCRFTWAGTNASGERVPAGVYWVRISGDSGSVSRRVAVVR